MKLVFAEGRRTEEIFETVIENVVQSALAMGIANIGEFPGRRRPLLLNRGSTSRHSNSRAAVGGRRRIPAAAPLASPPHLYQRISGNKYPRTNL
ncbi:MAG: hypothetical protein R3F11_20105 [Verrucomicrobiales bacterium]